MKDLTEFVYEQSPLSPVFSTGVQQELDLYLCVESHLVNKILADGFTARTRLNIAVENTIEGAKKGYNIHHKEPSVIFKVILNGQQVTFRNSRHSLRINTNHIPARQLFLLK